MTRTKDLRAARIARDEKDDEAIISVLKESFVDPFSEQPLLLISSGISIDQNVSKVVIAWSRFAEMKIQPLQSGQI